VRPFFFSSKFKYQLTKILTRNTKEKAPLLLTPGPVILSPSVRNALSQPMWHHRSLEFKQTLKQVSSDLQEIFQTKQPVLILHSTGTGAMEAALSNTLSPGEKVLCICTGKFGKRWKNIAQTFGMTVCSIDILPGKAVSVEMVKRELKKTKSIRALLVTACETSTATEQPIKEIAQILKNYPEVLLIVDGITALGAMELPMDEWGIDVLVAGSQKGFMIPTGLAFIALSEKAWKAESASSCPKYYFNLKKEQTAQAQGQTAFSSSVTLIRALKESLKSIKSQGLKNCILKCQALKKSTHVFCENLGLTLYSSRPANSVTAVELPEGVSAQRIKNNLQTYHKVILATGQGPLRDKILRIGHLGPIGPADHLKGLKALALELKREAPNHSDDATVKKALKQAEKTLNLELKI